MAGAVHGACEALQGLPTAGARTRLAVWAEAARLGDYPRASHAVSFERLARLMPDLLGLHISEGALVKILDDSRKAFAGQRSAIRARLLAGARAFSTSIEPEKCSSPLFRRVFFRKTGIHFSGKRSILQSGETGMRAGKKNWWLWVFSLSS